MANVFEYLTAETAEEAECGLQKRVSLRTLRLCGEHIE